MRSAISDEKRLFALNELLPNWGLKVSTRIGITPCIAEGRTKSPSRPRRTSPHGLGQFVDDPATLKRKYSGPHLCSGHHSYSAR